jgi:hypothetical protein
MMDVLHILHLRYRYQGLCRRILHHSSILPPRFSSQQAQQRLEKADRGGPDWVDLTGLVRCDPLHYIELRIGENARQHGFAKENIEDYGDATVRSKVISNELTVVVDTEKAGHVTDSAPGGCGRRRNSHVCLNCCSKLASVQHHEIIKPEGRKYFRHQSL